MSPEKAGSLVPHSSLKSVHYTIGALAHGEVLMLQATNEQCNVCTLYMEPSNQEAQRKISVITKNMTIRPLLLSEATSNLLDKKWCAFRANSKQH